MKKTVFCAVLILVLALGAVAYAAPTTADSIIFNPDNYYDTATDTPETLPTSGRLRAYADNTSVATTAKETDGNIVFNLTGTTVLTDNRSNYRQNPGFNTRSATKSHSVKINLPAENAGVVGLFSFTATSMTAELQDSKTAVLVKNGGVYMQKTAASGVTEVEVVAAGTLAADTWYTVEIKHDVYATGHLAAKVTVKAADSTVIGESDWMRIGDTAFNTSLSATTNAIMQHYTSDSFNGVKLDEWTMSIVSGVAAKNTLTATQDDDVTRRTTHRLALASDVALNPTSLANTVSVEGMQADEYTVSFDATTYDIVVTLDNPIPFGQTKTIKLSSDSFIETTEGFVAFDYSTISKSYTVGPYADLFTITVSADGQTVDFNNRDTEDREYIIITTHRRAGKYLDTKAVYGTVAVGSLSTPTVVTGVAVPAFTTQSGDTVTVMVWNNWNDMDSLSQCTQRREIIVP